MRNFGPLLSIFLIAFGGLERGYASLQCEHLFRAGKSVQYEIEAEKAGLIYITDFSKGTSYSNDPKRFNALGISAEYKDVWFSANKRSHIQAVAVDASGKKQYFYHPKWKAIRDNLKFGRLQAFGEVLPHIRRQIRKSISYLGFSRERALAAAVMVLDQTGIRIGDQEYTENNQTYGLTTMTRKQLKKIGGKYFFVFNGKASQRHRIKIEDDRVIKYLEESLRQPGKHIFKYIDDDGNMRFIVNSSVNEYLKSLSGIDISAKDFRTWIGTVAAAEFLYNAKDKDDEKIINKAADYAAEKLGNTRAVALESYIHPQILVAFIQGNAFNKAFKEAEGDAEAAVLFMLAGEKEERNEK